MNLQKGWVNTFVRNSTKAQKLYLKILKSAAKEILLIFPTTNALVRHEKIGVIQSLIEVAKEQQVKVRILMPISKLTEHIVQSLTQQQQNNISNNNQVYAVTCGTAAMREEVRGKGAE